MKSLLLSQMPRLLPVALVGGAALATLPGCEKTVRLDLNLIEPFDQQNQALNGVQSLRIEYEPSDPASEAEGNAVNLTLDETGSSSGLVFDLEDEVVLTVLAYEGDIAQDPSIISRPPDAIGRTVPVRAEGAAAELSLTLPVGILDSFGQTTTVDENGVAVATRMDTGAAVTGRHGHTATWLPTLGKVLIVGGAVWVEDATANSDLPQCRTFDDGIQRCFTILKTAELFDPTTGTFETLGEELPNARAYHTATALADGRVLIAGGFTFLSRGAGEPPGLETLVNGFLFNPDDLQNPYSAPIVFTARRAMHAAVLIEDQGDLGQVALIGGCHGSGCSPFTTIPQSLDPADDPVNKVVNVVEIFDVASSAAGPVALEPAFASSLARMRHAATRMGDFIVVSGGMNGDGTLCTVEILGVQGGTLVQPQPYPDDAVRTLGVCPAGHTQITLARDTIAVIGGVLDAPGGVLDDGAAPTSRVQFWKTTGPAPTVLEMLSARVLHASALLSDGSILNIGGRVPLGGATAERLELQTDGSFLPVPLALPLQDPRADIGMAPLPNGQVLVTGGYVSTNGSTSDRGELYFSN